MDNLWLALALLCVLEGVGPMLFPNKWRNYVRSLGQLPVKQIQTVGGGIVIIGLIGVWVLLA